MSPSRLALVETGASSIWTPSLFPMLTGLATNALDDRLKKSARGKRTSFQLYAETDTGITVDARL